MKVTFGTLSLPFFLKHCGFDTYFSFCPITLKLHKYVVYDKIDTGL